METISATQQRHAFGGGIHFFLQAAIQIGIDLGFIDVWHDHGARSSLGTLLSFQRSSLILIASRE